MYPKRRYLFRAEGTYIREFEISTRHEVDTAAIAGLVKVLKRLEKRTASQALI
jgi:hypothetical protein